MLAEVITKCPDHVLVLESDRDIVGWAHCLPLQRSISRQAFIDAAEPQALFSASNVLEASEAWQLAESGSGNRCWIGMVAVDQKTGVERYDGAIPLFLDLLWAMYGLGMRELFAHTSTILSGEILRRAGAVEVRRLTPTTDGPVSIWHFDDNAAAVNVPSGLSVVYFTRWGFGAGPGKMKLTSREREMVQLVLAGYETDDQLATEMSLSKETIKSYWRTVFEKATAIGLFEVADRSNRLRVVRYCHRHPEELGQLPFARGRAGGVGSGGP